MSDDLPTTPLPGPPDPDSHPTGALHSAATGDMGPGAAPRSGPRVPDPGLTDKQIGPYTILSVLGEGGFGVVYLAERTQPFQQRVAIKVIKPGMDSAAVIGRFELEKQSLAVMDHPNVARVLDAGTTESGRPYFVMEYVPGESITKFCDSRGYNLRQRLELMSQVCDAVQHAHLKGLIHRDLKPGNIMVELVDGTAIAKVIDFGIAKAIQQDALAESAFTLEGMLIGTPEYMSPEQAGGELDIDTRTDIYSLGVILYELLTGVLPFDPRDLRSRGLAEIQRIIREVDPPRPSTRVGETASATSAVARDRKTQFKTLERTLRRELEWIPLKAMRKDRARRYKTAQELRDDIARYLTGQALTAGPESRLYRARKFASRNRAGVAAAAVVLVAIVAASVVSVRFGIRERDARLAESKARAEAVTQRDTAQTVNDFLIIDMLGAANAEAEDAAQADPDIKVVTVLDRAALAITARLMDRPSVRVPVLRTIGQAYLNIGRPAQALPLLEEAVSVDDASHVLDRDARDWLVISLSECLFRQQKSEDAIVRLGAAIDSRRAALGGSQPDALLARLLHTLGGVNKWGGKYDEAERAYTEALEIRTRVLPPESTPILSTTYNLIGIEEARARADLFAAYSAKDEAAKKQAIERMREVRDRMRSLADRCTASLGPTADTALAARGEVAYMTNLTGDYEAGIRLYTELLPVMKQALTDHHWRVLMCSANLADAYRRTRRHEEAVVLLKDLVELYRQVRGPTFGETVTVTEWYANSLEQSGKPDASAAALERLFGDLKDGGDKPLQLKALATGIAALYGRQGKSDPEHSWRQTAAEFDAPTPR